MKNPSYQWGDNNRIKTILSLEEKYPVHEWKINGIHIWPAVRAFLYIELWVETERKNATAVKAQTKSPKVIKRISHFERVIILFRFLKFLLKPLKKSQAVFASSPSYLEEFQGKKYHKYFDPWRLNNAAYRDAFIVFNGKQEISGIPAQFNTGQFQYIFQLFAKFYRRRGFQNELPGFEEFRQELSSQYDVGKRLTLEAIQEAVVSIEQHAYLFKILLRKTGAQEAISMCYYNDTREHFGLNLAAHRMGITSVDVQHGGQGISHLAYSQFYKLPETRQYELLPSSFWCWDEASAASIQTWINEGSAKHSVRIIGHPWFQFLKFTQITKETKPIIVYSLQPFQTLLLSQVIECIQETGNAFSWILRLHPSMQWRKDELMELIRINKLESAIHEQTFSPLTLPETLAQAHLHITRTSGTVIEATLMGVTTLILDSDGAQAYKQYIAAGTAIDASRWSGSDIARYMQSKTDS